MRSPVIAAFLAVTTAVAFAQPGQAPAPAPYPPAPAPYPPAPAPPPQQPYVPPPYMYQPPVQVQITAEEAKLLARGEISSGQHLGGIALNWFVGFGLGQALQGRWSERGWIFTFGELGSLAAVFIGAARMAESDFCDYGDCYDNDDDGEALVIMGIFGYLGFKVWGLVDAAIGPSTHNRKVRELRQRVGYQQGYYYGGITPFVAPAAKGDGGTAGITIRF